MNCTSCGTTLPPGAATCPVCWAPTPYNVAGQRGNVPPNNPVLALSSPPSYGGNPPTPPYANNPSSGPYNGNPPTPSGPYGNNPSSGPYNGNPPPSAGSYGAPPPPQTGYGMPPAPPTGYGPSSYNPSSGSQYSGIGTDPYTVPSQQQQTFVPPPVNPVNPVNPTPPPKKSGRSRVLILTIVAVLVVLIGAGIVAAVTINNNNVNTQHANATATSQAQATLAQHQTATVGAQQGQTATAVAVANTYPFSSNLVLNDPLTDNSKGAKWDSVAPTASAGGCVFSGQAYHVSEPQKGFYNTCMGTNTNFANFTFEAELMIHQGDAGGLVFRANSGVTKFYDFVLDQDGSYSVLVHVDTGGTNTRTLTSGNVANFNTGLDQTNLVSVVARGSAIDLYVNSQKVTSLTDSTYTSGEIGFSTYALNGATECVFTNAKVWQLS